MCVVTSCLKHQEMDLELLYFQAAALILLIKKRKRDRERKKRIWMKRWLRRRDECGSNSLRLCKDLMENPDDFKNYTGLPLRMYNDLLSKVAPLIERKNSRLRKAISSESRLLVTLRYLKTGSTYKSLGFETAISRQSIGNIIPETCKMTHRVLKDYIKVRRFLSFLTCLTHRTIFTLPPHRTPPLYIW